MMLLAQQHAGTASEGPDAPKRSLKNPPFYHRKCPTPKKKRRNVIYTIPKNDGPWNFVTPAENVMLGFFNSFNFSILPLENQKWQWKYNPSKMYSRQKKWVTFQPTMSRFSTLPGAQKSTAAACWVGNARPPSAILKAWHVRQLEHRRPGAWPTKNDPQKMGESIVLNPVISPSSSSSL